MSLTELSLSLTFFSYCDFKSLNQISIHKREGKNENKIKKNIHNLTVKLCHRRLGIFFLSFFLYFLFRHYLIVLLMLVALLYSSKILRILLI